MNHSTDQSSNLCGVGIDAAIDRLVCNDLDDVSRAELVSFLERRPELWRNVAVAYMEANCWQEALTSDAKHGAEKIDEPTHRALPRQAVETRMNRRSWSRSALIAACLLVAFVAGQQVGNRIRPASIVSSGSREWETHSVAQSAQGNHSEPRNQLVWATLPHELFNAPVEGARLQIPLRIDASGNAIEVLVSRPPSEQERKLLHQRGFSLATKQRFVAAKLPDGSNVSIPLTDYVAIPDPRSIN